MHYLSNRFESTIIGQFYGHTHTDSFKVFFDDDNMTRATRYTAAASAHLWLGYMYIADSSG